MRTERTVDVTPPAVEPACPYRGPGVFQDADAGWYVISENYALVGRPSDEELREVIEGSARKGDLRLEEGLADWMLDDVASDPAPLAALSRLLRETWNLRKGRILTIEGYEQARVLTQPGSVADRQTPSRIKPQRAGPQTASAPAAAPPEPKTPTARPSRGTPRWRGQPHANPDAAGIGGVVSPGRARVSGPRTPADPDGSLALTV